MSKFRDPAEAVLAMVKAHASESDSVELTSRLGDDLEIDSLDLVEIELELEDEYDGVRFDDAVVYNMTVQAVIDMVKAKIAAAKL